MKKLFSTMSSLQAHSPFKLDFQTLAQPTGGKWLIHSTKHQKDNALQSLELPVEYPDRESKHDIKKSKVTCSINI